MHELSVTEVWMAGVVGMMLVFGVIAWVGVKQSNHEDKND